MIDKILAERLIEKISQTTEYNVNIMNEDGVIIASRMKERVGSFHEVAFSLLRGEETSCIVTKEDAENGIMPGVNMVIFVNHQREGVVGLTGDPREVMPIAKIVKMSVEVMLEYELYKYERLRKYNLREQLMHLLLYSEQISRDALDPYTSALRLKEDAVRIPILLECGDKQKREKILNGLLEENRQSGGQTLIDTTREESIMLFKSLQCADSMLMQQYRFILEEYLRPYMEYAESHGVKLTAYVGPMQNDFMQYRQSYLYCLWLQKNIPGGGIRHFYDYIVKYLESVAPMSEFHAIFLMIKKKLGPKVIAGFLETMEALIEKDYSLSKAGEYLHVHKNTIVYRLNKIREVLNINPLSSNTDREFMECFYYYLKRR